MDDPVSEELLTALLKSLYMAGKDEHTFKEETKDLTTSAILGSTN